MPTNPQSGLKHRRRAPASTTMAVHMSSRPNKCTRVGLSLPHAAVRDLQTAGNHQHHSAQKGRATRAQNLAAMPKYAHAGKCRQRECTRTRPHDWRSAASPHVTALPCVFGDDVSFLVDGLKVMRQ